MRLKSLKLAGFKSFANPTTFSFKHDITAIVGPNGCGKSNVIDAIRWVLGESSAKQLRGGAMSDVIFAGADGRAGRSMASVELTFEHTQDETHGIRHALNLYQELTLRRQISKDGKSDYFINGQRVRRRDVVDVFLGTGLSSRSYAVIGQGMIGRIVESNPLQLREFIEEAAGVSRYQARREETQKQLTVATDNLVRLQDLQSELSKQQKLLSRQAQSAQKYRALSEQLNALQKQALLGRIFLTWQTKQTEKQTQNQYLQQLSQLENDSQNAKQSLETLADKLAQAQWLKDDMRDKYHQACLIEQNTKHQLNQLNLQIQQHEQKITLLERNQAEILSTLTQTDDELNKIDDQLQKIAPELQLAQTKQQQHQEVIKQLQEDLEQTNHLLTDLIKQKQSLEHEQKSIHQQLTRLALAQEKWTKKHAELMAQKDTFSTVLEPDIIQTLDDQIEQLKSRLIDEQAEVQKITLNQSQSHVQTLEQEMIALEKRHAVFMGEYDTLHKLLYQPTTGAPIDDEAFKTLQTQISLSPLGQKFAPVLDAFLGFWLDAKTAKQLPASLLTTHPNSKDKAYLLTAPQPENQSLPKSLLPLSALLSPSLVAWQNIYLWQDEPSSTDELMSTYINQGALILTLTGWLWGRFGAIHISKFGEAGDFFGQKLTHQNRLDELETLLGELEEHMEDKNHALKKARGELEQITIAQQEKQAQVSALTIQLHQKEQALIQAQAKINEQKLWQATFDKSLLALNEEQTELTDENKHYQQAQAHCQEALNQCLPTLTALQEKAQTLNTTLKQHKAKIQTLAEAYQALYLKQNNLSQAKNHANKLLQMAQQTLKQHTSEQQKYDVQLKQVMALLPTHQSEAQNAQQEVAQLKIQLEEYEATNSALLHQQQTAQQTLSATQEHIVNTQTLLAQSEAKLSLAQSRLEDLAEEMLALEADFVLAVALEQLPKNPPELSDNDQQYQALKEELDSLGAVNMVAEIELKEVMTRQQQMNQQIGDITQSMDKLQTAISTIDDKTKSLFLMTLEAVNAELNTLFIKMFGGGQASLTLVDDEQLTKADKWRAGLVLMAQPKGKKNSRLAVLSGGEKTLTALSLIFAIFKQHPAPFCVLDEVDAPLDDVNVGRFTSLIGELASSVQFIFISHNKLAMQVADELKGITMPTAGISSLVTVNLQEAQKYLEVK